MKQNKLIFSGEENSEDVTQQELSDDLFKHLSSADNLCKYFGTRWGPTKYLSWSGLKLFDTLIVFMKEIFGKS